MQFENWFARLPRDLRRAIPLATLRRHDGGHGVSLLPVLALESWGRETAVERYTHELAGYAGLSASELRRGFSSLGEVGLLTAPLEQSVRATRFRLAPGVVATDKVGRFAFPGRLVGSGLWARLPLAEQSVLLTLGALARPQVHSTSDDLALDADDWEWLNHATTVRTREDPTPRAYSAEIAYNVGEFDVDEVAELAGLRRAAVACAFDRLFTHADGALVRFRSRERGDLYALPPEWWAPPFVREVARGGG